MSHTTASLFTGGAIFETGALAAGLTPVWGVEIVPDIADVAERNITGLSVIRSDVAAVDYSSLPKVYRLHASPSCKNASQANSDGGEAQEDINSAQAICRAIEQVGPVAFTLENVWQYREFDAFRLVLGTLHELGYAFDYWHLNSADYGVPQTRKRLILIARRDGKPVVMPRQTHTENPAPQMDMFGGEFGLRRWVGWYEAIGDLIGGLPDSKFAPWQLARLPEELKPLLINGAGNTNFAEAKPGKGCRYTDEPAMTVTTVTKDGGELPKALLMSVGISRDHKGNEYENCRRSPDEPAYTVTANSNQGGVRAFIVPGDNTGNGVIRLASEPMSTIQTRTPGQCPHRAFLTSDNYGAPNTVDERKLQLYGPSEPAMTVRGRAKTTMKAYVGCVVKMTPRALARFQSIPDWYSLPESNSLACTIIGNGVPTLLAKAICENIK